MGEFKVCILIQSPKGKKLSKDIAQNCVDQNPDGFGILYLDTGEVYRTMSPKKWVSRATSSRPMVLHCRWATVGSVRIDNVHPFPVKFQSGESGHLFQNGSENFRAPDDCTDCEVIGRMIGKLTIDAAIEFLSNLRSKFILSVVDGGGGNRRTVRTGKFTKDHGIQFSQTAVLNSRRWYSGGCSWNWSSMVSAPKPAPAPKPEPKPEPKPTEYGSILIGVYGTPISGGSRSEILDGAEFIGSAITKPKFKLVRRFSENEFSLRLGGINRGAGCMPVSMEVYRVKFGSDTYNRFHDFHALRGSRTRVSVQTSDVLTGESRRVWVWTYPDALVAGSRGFDCYWSAFADVPQLGELVGAGSLSESSRLLDCEVDHWSGFQLGAS